MGRPEEQRDLVARAGADEFLVQTSAESFDPSFLVTHRYGLDDALRENVSTSEPRGKVVIDLSTI